MNTDLYIDTNIFMNDAQTGYTEERSDNSDKNYKVGDRNVEKQDYILSSIRNTYFCKVYVWKKSNIKKSQYTMDELYEMKKPKKRRASEE